MEAFICLRDGLDLHRLRLRESKQPLLWKTDRERLRALGSKIVVELGGFEQARHPIFGWQRPQEWALYEIALLDVLGDGYIRAAKSVTSLSESPIRDGRWDADKHREDLIAENRQEIAARFVQLVDEHS